jgi:lipopolysaccharide transport system permease protein
MENKVVTVISAKEKFNLGLKEIVQYKDLFYTLAWRDFKVRYAQTVLGLAWAFVQPVLTLMVLTIIFTRVMNLWTFGVNPLPYTMSGTLLWGFFAYVLTNSGNSIIGAQGMIKKIYFPRLIIPLSKAVVGLIDFGISAVILIVLIIYYKAPVAPTAIFCLFFIFTTIVAALGIGIWVSALTIRYRDFQFIVPFAVQLGLFVSPIGYPIESVLHSEVLPKWAQAAYFLNPMAGNIQAFRFYLFGQLDNSQIAPGNMAMISIFMSFFLLVTGLIYFKKAEKDIADIV